MTKPNPAAQPVAADTLIENLSRIDEDDHERGCSGRYYSCSCGFDDHIYKTSRAAIAEIIRLQAEVEEATNVLSCLSSYLGAGLGDDKTTTNEFDDRIRWGIDHMVCAAIQRCADVVEECSKRPNTGWGQLKKRILDLKPEYEASDTAARAALSPGGE